MRTLITLINTNLYHLSDLPFSYLLWYNLYYRKGDENHSSSDLISDKSVSSQIETCRTNPLQYFHFLIFQTKSVGLCSMVYHCSHKATRRKFNFILKNTTLWKREQKFLILIWKLETYTEIFIIRFQLNGYRGATF